MKYGPALASFPEPIEGYLVCAGQPGTGQQLKELMVTHDAGKTWSLISQDFSRVAMRAAWCSAQTDTAGTEEPGR